MSHRRSRVSSIMDTFSLNPLPYPVLLILAVIFIFLVIQWTSDYESMLESTEESMGLLLLATPLVILFAVQWLSTIENPESLFGWDQRRRTNYYRSSPSEGSSPWGVAVLILVLLVMAQYQSSFLDGWFV